MILRIFWKTRFFYIAICVALITYLPSIFGETTNDNDISEFLLNIVKDIINLKNSLRYVQRRVDNTTSSLERQHSDTAAQLRGHIDTLDSQQSRRLGELSNRLEKSWENTSAEGVIRNERVNVLEHRITNISAETRLEKGSLNATLMTFFTRLFGVGLSPILSQLSQLRRRVDRIQSSFKMVSHNRSALLRQKNVLFIPDVEEHSEEFYNSTASAPDLRLVGGTDLNRGRLEVFYEGLWGLVCSAGFDDIDATVACRQLGYGTGYVHRDDWQPDNGYAQADIICIGNESTLAECSRSITPGDCETIGSTLVVQCMDSVEDRMRGFRLVDGHDNSSGYVQLYVNGSWGSLCAKTQLSRSGWDLHDAEVFCRQLGIIRPTPRLLSSRRRNQSSLSEVKFVADAFNCNGEEPTLLHCPRVQVSAYQSSCGNTTEHAVYAHCESLLK